MNRAASGIPRHDGRVIWLTYEPEGPIEKTLMLVGKGITYDTGNHRQKATIIIILKPPISNSGIFEMAHFVKPYFIILNLTGEIKLVFDCL